MNLVARSIQRPVTVTVVVALIAIFGVLALRRVPVQLTPNVDRPVISVTTRWFGASPQEIVREVIEEQEDVLKTIEGLREMTAQATEGEASIRLEFAVNVDKDAALNEVRDKLRQVPEYPANVDQPVVESTDRFSRDYIAWVLVRRIPNFKPTAPPAPGFEHGDITKLGTFFDDYVKPVLERAEGVSEIQVLGGREREAQVRVDLTALAARGISVEQLTRALSNQNLDVTAGTIDEGKRSTSVRVVGQYDSPDQIARTVIAYTEAGAPVYVEDVGRIVLDFKKESGFVNSKGERVIAINAQRETGSNVLVVMENLKRAIAEVNENVLGKRNWGIFLDQVYDQTVYIDDAVSNAAVNLLIGAGLAAVVLLLTLRSVGATMVIIVAIPISVVGTLLGMAMLGRSLNVISMAGLTFAVGMGIDNAIVVLENIFRHREMGKDRIAAAVDGASEVWGAIVAATLTNVAVFLPVIFIREEAGQLFRDLSVALTISFFFYLFVAPTVVPMLATLFLRNVPQAMRGGLAADASAHETRLGHATSGIGRLERRVADLFYRGVYALTGGFLRRVLLVAALVVVAVGVSVKLMPPTDYLPKGNQNLIFGFVLPPPGYNVAEYGRIASVVEGQLRPWWEARDNPSTLPGLQQGYLAGIRDFAIPAIEKQIADQRAQMSAAGMPPESIDKAVEFMEGMLEDMRRAAAPPAIDNFFFVNFGNFVFMGASSVDRFNVSPLALLMNGTLRAIPGTFGFFQQASIFRDTSPGGVLELSVYGPDDAVVRQSAGALQGALMQTFQGFPRPDPANYNLGRDEVQVKIDHVRASAAGIGGAPAIRAAVQAAVDGVIVGDYREAGETIDLTVVSDRPRDARFREQLADIPMPARGGQVVPLDSVATLEQTVAPQQINRSEEQSSVTFTVQLPEGMTIGQAVDAVQQQIEPGLRASGAMPGDVNIKLRGSAGKLREFVAAFLPGFILAAVITYLLLASLYENFLHPITIILTVPFAMAGGFAALGTLHAFVPLAKLDVLTMLGFVILIGTVVNNPILIVHQALNYMRDGMDKRRAVALSTQTRVRPIFMSVVTSVAGMAPLVVFGGAGSELYRGLGAVLVGGLLVSTVFTLIVTPTLMSLLLDLQDGWSRLLRKPSGSRGNGDRGVGRSAPPVEPPKAPASPEAELVAVSRQS